MSESIDIQHASEDSVPVSDKTIREWVNLVLDSNSTHAELTVRLVDPDEMVYLNHQYRQQNKTTNVLAFPSELPSHIHLDTPLLGDVIICPHVLQQESETLNKPLVAHWAHIVIHGVLHLLGYDHIEEAEAQTMQQLEARLLTKLGFKNPYQIEESEIE